MNILDYLIPFVLALGLLILVHELGHYLVARWAGVKVLRFSIGFGRPLVAWTMGPDRTEWALSAFPLGGYVKMLDEREGPVESAELHRAFNRQPVGRRFAIVAAGPLANFLLAILLYWGLFVGGTEELKPQLALTGADSIAAHAGVREGDLVETVDDEPVRSWPELRWVLLRHALDARSVTLRVRTAEGVEAFRSLDLSGVAVEDAERDLIADLGLRPWRPHVDAVIGKLVEGGPADRAGVQVGDRVLELGGQRIDSWGDLVGVVREKPELPLKAIIDRRGTRVELAMTPDRAEEGGRVIGKIGVGVGELDAAEARKSVVVVRYGVFEGLAKALGQTWDTSVLSLKMIGRMIIGEISWKNLSGPVTIADYAGQSAKLGLDHYLKFVALISISLGVLNLLPIPVLDGGHLLYYVIEIIKGGPIPERVMEIGQQIGLVALAMLMAFAFYNDINRLISG